MIQMSYENQIIQNSSWAYHKDIYIILSKKSNNDNVIIDEIIIFFIDYLSKVDEHEYILLSQYFFLDV